MPTRVNFESLNSGEDLEVIQERLHQSGLQLQNNAEKKKTMKSYENKVIQIQNFLDTFFPDRAKLYDLEQSSNNSPSLVMRDKPSVAEMAAFCSAKRALNPNIKSKTLGQFRSAVNKMISLSPHRDDINDYTERELEQMSRIFKGAQNESSISAREGLINPEEGKRHLTVAEFMLVCLNSLLLAELFSRNPFEVHLFVTIAWSLCARMDTASAIHAAHITWEADALLVGISRSKRNYSESTTYFRVYANPFLPEVCGHYTNCVGGEMTYSCSFFLACVSIAITDSSLGVPCFGLGSPPAIESCNLTGISAAVPWRRC